MIYEIGLRGNTINLDHCETCEMADWRAHKYCLLEHSNVSWGYAYVWNDPWLTMWSWKILIYDNNSCITDSVWSVSTLIFATLSKSMSHISQYVLNFGMEWVCPLLHLNTKSSAGILVLNGACTSIEGKEKNCTMLEKMRR